jgi:NADPH-dependent 2,4-dienoyl-CoA reductase/sulfur reductase-like enzyme
VRENKVDLVALGRSLLADPQLPQKYAEGRAEQVAPCIACNECVAMQNKGWQLHCVVNPLLSSEYLDPVKPAGTPKKVLVIGGGPAGMQCAVTAAMRGHKVTLAEGSGKLGGQLVAASTPAYKSQEIGAFIGYLSMLVKKYGVEVKLSTEVDAQLPDGQTPDVAVIATGALPDCPSFEGADNVASAYEVLLKKGAGVGDRVVVIGSSGVGIDVALYLMERKGRMVTVMSGVGKNDRWVWGACVRQGGFGMRLCAVEGGRACEDARREGDCRAGNFEEEDCEDGQRAGSFVRAVPDQGDEAQEPHRDGADAHEVRLGVGGGDR